MLYAGLVGKHEKSKRKNVQYLIETSEFQKAIAEARKKLGFTNKQPVEEGYIYEWVVNSLDGNNNQRQVYEVVQKTGKQAFDEVNKVLDKLHLPNEWSFFIIVYIVNGTPPQSIAFGDVEAITVQEVKENGELVIRLKPGLRKEDYVKAWNTFHSYLGQAKSLDKPYTNADINQQIYGDKVVGLTYAQLAKKYFASHYYRDKVSAIDKVKKIVRREKHRQAGGQK